MSKIIWYIFEIAVNAYQGFLMVYFLRKCLHPKHRVGIRDIVCVIFITGFFTTYLFWSFPIPDTCVFLIPLIYSILCFTDKLQVKMFWLLLLAILMTTVINLIFSFFTFVLGANWESVMAKETILRFSYINICNAAVSLFIFLITKIKQTKGLLSWIAFALLIVENLVYLFIQEYLFSLRYSQYIENFLFFWACIGIFLCSVISFLIYEILSANAEKELQYRQQLQILNLSAHHQEELKGVYSQLVAHQHDLKHEIQAIEQLLETNHTHEGKQLLQEMKDMAVTCEFTTGNLAVDALLTAKKGVMAQKNIEFEYSLHSLTSCPLNSVQLCAVIGNLLDNAIEAIERRSEQDCGKTIRLTFERARNVMCITCENPMNPSTIRKIDDIYVSSKNDRNHGYGLSSIRSIVESSGGECCFTIKDNRFIACITFYLIQEGYYDQLVDKEDHQNNAQA